MAFCGSFWFLLLCAILWRCNAVYTADESNNCLVIMDSIYYNLNLGEVGNGNDHYWEMKPAADAYAGFVMSNQPNNGGFYSTMSVAIDTAPRLSYNIEIPDSCASDTFYLHVRAFSEDSDDNSFHFTKDNENQNLMERLQIDNHGVWEWVDDGDASGIADFTWTGGAGIHTLDCYMREDGVFIDRIVITTDSGYDPSATYLSMSVGYIDVSSSEVAVEDLSTNAVTLSPYPFEITYVDGNLARAAIRFPSVELPQNGVPINYAYLTFQALSVGSGSSGLGEFTIYAEAADDSSALTSGASDLTSRTITSSRATWTPSDWTTLGGNEDTTSIMLDLANVVSEVSERSGWASGNAITFIIEGSGASRLAELNVDLYISYSGETDSPTLADPVKNDEITGNVINFDFTLPGDAYTGTARLIFDDGVEEQYLYLSTETSGQQVFSWNALTDPTLLSEISSSTITFLSPGSYDISIGYRDLFPHTENRATATSVCYRCGGVAALSPVNTNGASASSDAGNCWNNDNNIYVEEDWGVIFAGLALPQGFDVDKCWMTVEATKDEVDPSFTTMYVQDAVAVPYFTGANCVGSRTKSTASVVWEFTVQGDGLYYDSPRIESLINYVMDRGDWTASTQFALLGDPSDGGYWYRWASHRQAQRPVLHCQWYTQTPTLTLPADNTEYPSDLDISFTLPEDPTPGTVILEFDNTLGRRENFTLAVTTASTVSFTWIIDQDPNGLSEVTSSSTLALVPGPYTVTLSYQDKDGNPPAYMESIGVVIGTCAPGYTGSPGSCTPCAPNTYKELAGSQACDACSTGASSPAASTSATACVCDAGWTGPDGGICTECSQGKYKSITGDAACTSCGANEGTASTGSTSVGDCICGVGYEGSPGSCTACASGDSSEPGQPCTACPAYTDTGGATGSACICQAGYYGIAPDCFPCPVGTFKAASGDGPSSLCLACSNGDTSGLGSSACTGAPPVWIQDTVTPIIADAQLTASSFFDGNHAPRCARLYATTYCGADAWASSDSDGDGDWIQVDLLEEYVLFGVATQGRADTDQWLTEFDLSTTNDATHAFYTDHGRRTGNSDRNTVVYNSFSTPVSARYVRITTCGASCRYGWNSLRWEVYGLRPATSPVLSLSNPSDSTVDLSWTPGTAKDCTFSHWNVIIASGAVGETGLVPTGCDAVTLNARGTTSCTASGLTSDTAYILEVNEVCTETLANSEAGSNLFATWPVGVCGAGYEGSFPACTPCAAEFSSEAGEACVACPANTGTNGATGAACQCTAGYYSTAPSCIACPSNTYKATFGDGAVDLCVACASGTTSGEGSTGCSAWPPVQLEDLTPLIPDSQFTSSSQFHNNARPHCARLNMVSYTTPAASVNCNWDSFLWSGCCNDNEWLQVDLGEPYRLVGIGTQGRGDADQWLTAYDVWTGNDNTWTTYTDHGRLTGNSDRNTVVYHSLGSTPLFQQYVRIITCGTTCVNGYNVLRWEIYGQRPAGTPTGIVLASATAWSLDVSWTAGATKDCVFSHWSVTIASGPTSEVGITPTGCDSATLSARGTVSCTASDLASTTSYTFDVSEICTNTLANSFAGTSTALSTLDVAGAPLVYFGTRGVTSIDIDWIPGAPLGCVFSSWDVQCVSGCTGIPTGCTGLAARGTTSCTATGLTFGTDYSFSVQELCTDSRWDSTLGYNSTFTQGPALAPTVPYPIATDVGLEQITLSWIPGFAETCVFSSWDVICVFGCPGAPITPAGCTGLTSRSTVSCTTTGLTPGDFHQFTVQETCTSSASDSALGTSPFILTVADDFIIDPYMISSTEAAAQMQGPPGTGYTIYCSVGISTSVPTPAQIKAGANADGTAAIDVVSAAAVAALQTLPAFTGLLGTTMTAFCIAESTGYPGYFTPIYSVVVLPTWSNAPAIVFTTSTEIALEIGVGPGFTATCICDTDGGTPTNAQIRAGQNSLGFGTDFFDHAGTGALVSPVHTYTGLTPGATYNLWCTFEDDADPGAYGVPTLLTTTLSNDPWTVTPTYGSNEPTTTTIDVQWNHPNLYSIYCILDAAPGSPTPDEVSLGQIAGGTAADSAFGPVSANGALQDNVAQFTGLSENTAYDYVCIGELDANPGLTFSQFATGSLKSKITWSFNANSEPAVASILPGLSTIDIQYTFENLFTMYCICDTNTATPTDAQIKAGQHAGGVAAEDSASLATNGANQDTAIQFTGLSSETDYYIFCVAEDNALPGEFSTISTRLDLSTIGWINDPAEATIAPSDTTIDIQFAFPSPDWTVYCVADDALGSPTEAQIVAGQDSGSVAAAASGNIASTGAIQDTAIQFTGLTQFTTYDIACAAQRGADSALSDIRTVTISTLKDWTTGGVNPSQATIVPGFTTIDIQFQFENLWQVYCIADTNALAPTAAQIKAGQKQGGGAAIDSADIGSTGAVQDTALQFAGLTSNTQYHIFCAAEALPIGTNVFSLVSPSLDISTAVDWTLAPAISASVPETDTTIDIMFNMDSAYTVYCICDPSATTPTAAEILLGQKAGGAAAVDSDNTGATGALQDSGMQFTGLSEFVQYNIFCVADNSPLQSTIAGLTQTTRKSWAVQPAISAVIETTSDTIDLQIDFDNQWTVYCTGDTDTNTPTVVEVIAGQISGGATADASFTFSATGALVDSAGQLTLPSGLDNTDIEIWCAAESDLFPGSYSLLSNGITERTARTWNSAPNDSASPNSDTENVIPRFRCNNQYSSYCTADTSTATPTRDEVYNGQIAGGAAATASASVACSGGNQELAFDGTLDDFVQFRVYCVMERDSIPGYYGEVAFVDLKTVMDWDRIATPPAAGLQTATEIPFTVRFPVGSQGYCIADTSAGGGITAADIIIGDKDGGGAADAALGPIVGTGGLLTRSFTGLNPVTTYNIYCMTDDSSNPGFYSVVSPVLTVTTAADWANPPTLSAGSLSKFAYDVKWDFGTVGYDISCVLDSTSTVMPTSTEILNGAVAGGGIGSAEFSALLIASSVGVVDPAISWSGLQAYTNYSMFCVAELSPGPNIQSSVVSTFVRTLAGFNIDPSEASINPTPSTIDLQFNFPSAWTVYCTADTDDSTPTQAEIRNCAIAGGGASSAEQCTSVSGTGNLEDTALQFTGLSQYTNYSIWCVGELDGSPGTLAEVPPAIYIQTTQDWTTLPFISTSPITVYGFDVEFEFIAADYRVYCIVDLENSAPTENQIRSGKNSLNQNADYDFSRLGTGAPDSVSMAPSQFQTYYIYCVARELARGYYSSISPVLTAFVPGIAGRPVAVSSSNLGNDYLTLSWNAGTPRSCVFDHWDVEYVVGDTGAPVNCAPSDMNDRSVRSCTITGLAPAGSFSFRVRENCTNAELAVTSDWSVPSTLVTLPVPPVVPKWVNVTQVGADKQLITWLSPNAGSDCVFAGWNVQFVHGDMSGAAPGCAVFSRSVQYCTATGLSEATTYSYTVEETCVNPNINTGPSSVSNNATTLTKATPPTSFTLSSPTTSTMDVSWVAGTANDCVFLKWDIRDDATGLTVTGCNSLSSRSTLSCTATGLTPGLNYRFNIREQCTDGWANAHSTYASSNLRSTFSGAEAPLVVSKEPTATTFNISWTPQSSGDCTFTNWRVYFYSTTTEPTGCTGMNDRSVTSCTATGLTPSTYYQFTVTEECSISFLNSATSNPTAYSFTLGPADTPSLTLVPFVSSIQITWSPADPKSCLFLRWALLETFPAAGVEPVQCTPVLGTESSKTCTVSGLPSGSTYNYTIQRTCTNGYDSAVSLIASTATLIPATPPVSVTASDPTYYTAQIDWSPGIPNDCTFSHWHVEIASGITPINPISGCTQAALSSRAITSCRFAGLVDGSTYTFQVTEACLNNGASTATVSNTVTLQGEIPQAVDISVLVEPGDTVMITLQGNAANLAHYEVTTLPALGTVHQVRSNYAIYGVGTKAAAQMSEGEVSLLDSIVFQAPASFGTSVAFVYTAVTLSGLRSNGTVWVSPQNEGIVASRFGTNADRWYSSYMSSFDIPARIDNDFFYIEAGYEPILFTDRWYFQYLVEDSYAVLFNGVIEFVMGRVHGDISSAVDSGLPLMTIHCDACNNGAGLVLGHAGFMNTDRETFSFSIDVESWGVDEGDGTGVNDWRRPSDCELWEALFLISDIRIWADVTDGYEIMYLDDVYFYAGSNPPAECYAIYYNGAATLS